MAGKLQHSERIVRADLEFLRCQGLLTGTAIGVEVTVEGQEVLASLGEMFNLFRGLKEMEDELSSLFKLRRSFVVSGNADDDPHVKLEMARVAAGFLEEMLQPGMILAVTGGTTVAAVAEALQSGSRQAELEVVPARGGLGEDVELQANTIAAKLARKLGASYRLLHAPDNLSAEALASLHGEKSIRQVLERLTRADVLLYGIGAAGDMAARRGIDQGEIQMILARGAVGEAFGYYFDDQGDIVYSSGSIGLQLDHLAQIKYPLAVAGGESKASAIVSVLSHIRRGILIIDHAAAAKILARR